MAEKRTSPRMAQVDVIDNLATDPFGVPTMNGHQEDVKHKWMSIDPVLDQ